ncbi:MAG: DUF2889 domain-containing protein [Alphaproteobacteria bacterium]|nr:DUF2889 domain-containing protein [Alphaproteobacteria bacterium]
MPLSPMIGRQHLHTRRVVCQGFFRDDGLWDIEGRITDEKTYEHANEWRGPLKPGDFVHDMSIRERLGGVHGCTHIVELLGPVATTAFQTVSSSKARELNRAHRARSGDTSKPADSTATPRPRRKPYVVDTCHAWASDGAVVKRWAPDFYTGPDAEAVRAAAAGKEVEIEG